MAFDNLPELELPELQPGDEVIKEIIPHSEATNDRSMARRLTLQVLYEIDSTQHSVGEVMNAQIVGFDQPVSDHTRAYMRYLVNGVMRYRTVLDDILRRYAPEFPLAQIAIIDRNILRIAALEFALYGITPVGVAIDEAVELAKLFGADGAPRFINGVLGALADDQKMLDALAEIIDAEEHEAQNGSQEGTQNDMPAASDANLNGTAAAGEYPPTEDASN
jgi:N utilization substance protein B